MHHLTVTEAELETYLATLPVDDDEPSEAELEAVAEGRAAAARGEFATPAEIAALVA